ncbi:MAG: hypothetical protein QOE90_777 [Thermoplasmata archaeon]|nr:hypothetical protein [Thermoplasmata archaeon]
MSPAGRGRCVIALAFVGLLLPAFPTHAAASQPAIDPTTLSFVPSPVVQSTFAPRGVASCSGAGSIGTGSHPAAETVSVMVRTHGCHVASATVTWTISGKTYAASVDPITGRLGLIHRVGSA